MRSRYRIHLAGLIFTILGCTTVSTIPHVEKIDPDTPIVPREFRAAWVASVANINWPSKPGLDTGTQKREALFLLDLLAENNFNAVILQIRPQCDALYNSDLEPWSYYLTGQQGIPPDPFYDPLSFWIEQAHFRGLELHAWLNPYRAHHPSGGDVSDFSLIKKKPELALELENGYWWLDPGQAGTQDHSFSVALDIVRRYDIDGLHFDDYFYPYPSYHPGREFPDSTSWQLYLAGGGTAKRSDWRRENVNIFIKHLYRAIKDIKPHVKFGLSPFGIWRPNNPSSIRGFDQYDQLYADARLWLNQGWIDYWTPQLYWPINQIPQSFPVLLGWWIGENDKNRHIWPGINIGRPEGEAGADETINQIMITRGMRPENPGIVHWSIGPLISDSLLLPALSQGPYKDRALIPATPWLNSQVPKPPVVETSVINDSLRISWVDNDPEQVFLWVLYAKYNQTWQYSIICRPAKNIALSLRRAESGRSEQNDLENLSSAFLNEIILTAVSRTGLESSKRFAWKSE